MTDDRLPNFSIRLRYYRRCIDTILTCGVVILRASKGYHLILCVTRATPLRRLIVVQDKCNSFRDLDRHYHPCLHQHLHPSCVKFAFGCFLLASSSLLLLLAWLVHQSSRIYSSPLALTVLRHYIMISQSLHSSTTTIDISYLSTNILLSYYSMSSICVRFQLLPELLTSYTSMKYGCFRQSPLCICPACLLY